jgi:translation initiation factor IF-1
MSNQNKGQQVERDRIEVEGQVIDASNGQFKVQVNDNHIVQATLAGRVRQNGIRILCGDTVICELSAFDLTRGRITYRLK